MKRGGPFDFEGQTAVVTGGTRGLGRAITRAFLETGATVHATYRSDEDAARGFADSLGALGERLHLARFDVASYPEVEAFWEPETSMTTNYCLRLEETFHYHRIPSLLKDDFHIFPLCEVYFTLRLDYRDRKLDDREVITEDLLQAEPPGQYHKIISLQTYLKKYIYTQNSLLLVPYP